MKQMFSVRQILPKPIAKQKPAPKAKAVTKSRKDKIPLALRQQVWIQRMGRVFEGKCPVTWCCNTINVFDFESGHNIPESKGGETSVTNLVPICSRCNKGMGNRYTIEDWCTKFSDSTSTESSKDPQTTPRVRFFSRYFSCF
jgi:5-methylcytosine-specific restriction endonuclease McrA